MSYTRALRHIGIAGALGCVGMTTLAIGQTETRAIAFALGLVGAVFAGGLLVATSVSTERERQRRIERSNYAKREVSQYDFPPATESTAGDAESMLQTAIALDEHLAAARSELGLFTAVVSSMEQGVVAVDRDERITLINNPARAAMVLNGQALEGRPLWEVCRNDALNQVVRTALSSTEASHAETTVSELGGRDRFLEFSATPVTDQYQQLLGAVVVINDTSHLRRLERVRRDFVTNISHELKTPLTAIRGMVETILDDGQMPEDIRKRFLKRVIVQGERLSDLVADLLTLSRLESAADAMDCRDLDFSTVVKTSTKQLLPAAKVKKVAIHTDFRTSSTQVFGDGEFLRQVADNLIDNAIKYSGDAGTVNVKLATEDQQVIFTVSDTGCGIAAADQERIFERFYRVDKARSRELGSTGLGLSIVKHIVHAHNGTIQVESSPGKGTTFTVRLPISAVNEPAV